MSFVKGDIVIIPVPFTTKNIDQRNDLPFSQAPDDPPVHTGFVRNPYSINTLNL
ncbi:MAG: hypothetical protein PHI28_18740 [Mangrovibacterium sp.]|nr:hypothetical protein [Mangrovibacterium sp.]